jgi:hypothetical protein
MRRQKEQQHQQQPPRDEKSKTTFLEFDFEMGPTTLLELDFGMGPIRNGASSESTINGDGEAAISIGERDDRAWLPTVVMEGAATDVVDWNGDDDPENPQNWSPPRKWVTIALVSSITFVT